MGELGVRLISYLSEGRQRVAGVRDGQYVDLHRADPGLPATMRELLRAEDGLSRAAAVLGQAPPLADQRVKLLAPVPDPPKILCIGLNYADHAREGGKEPPAEPVVFCKFQTAVLAPGDPIRLPRASHKVDYEAELVVVIGKAGRHIPRGRAREHVAGYCVGHDVSARDWQLEKPGGQWLLGKSFDTFAPFGPALVTADEVPDPQDLRIQLRLNGQTMQDSRTDQLIFGVDVLIEYISTVCTLLPGDVLFTGTPPGVGAARKPPVFLQPGDVVEVEIERLGTLRNPVAAEE